MSHADAVKVWAPVIGGTALEVHWYGPPAAEAPTLVFLHEGLGSAAQWRDFPQQLAMATGKSALVYSRAGYGQSDPVSLPRSARYLHHEGLEVLPELLEHLGVQQHLLIGHSDGGSIALINAGGAAQRGLLGVMTEAAHVFNEPLIPPAIRETVSLYENGDLRGKLARHHLDVEVAFRGWSDTWLSAEFLAWNIEEYLPNINVPVLAIQGQDDRYGTVRQVEAIVAQVSGPAEALLLPNCGHTPHREAANATFRAMQGFIERVCLIPQ